MGGGCSGLEFVIFSTKNPNLKFFFIWGVGVEGLEKVIFLLIIQIKIKLKIF